MHVILSFVANSGGNCRDIEWNGESWLCRWWKVSYVLHRMFLVLPVVFLVTLKC